MRADLGDLLQCFDKPEGAVDISCLAAPLDKRQYDSRSIPAFKLKRNHDKDVELSSCPLIGR
jgi:hypothetical protein